jgi:lipopolysaccharide transport protein LptA
MAAFYRNLSLAAALGAAAVLGTAPAGTAAGAAAVLRQQPIVLDAQSVDGSLDNTLFKKIRITQGDMSISADQARASEPVPARQNAPKKDRLDFENSVWQFRGNVHIDVDQGQVTSTDADITFLRSQLVSVVATGSPAEFQQRVAKNGRLAQGHADSIDYDAAKGVVKLSKNAFLTDGQGGEVHGETLKYDLLSQTIIADSAEQGSQRVHIVIPPPSSKP